MRPIVHKLLANNTLCHGKQQFAKTWYITALSLFYMKLMFFVHCPCSNKKT